MKLSPEQEKLAIEIATKLDDMKSLHMHRVYVQQYSEAHLRKALEVALYYDEKDVRTTRGAIYTSQVKNRWLLS